MCRGLPNLINEKQQHTHIDHHMGAAVVPSIGLCGVICFLQNKKNRNIFCAFSPSFILWHMFSRVFPSPSLLFLFSYLFWVVSCHIDPVFLERFSTLWYIDTVVTELFYLSNIVVDSLLAQFRVVPQTF